MTSWSPLLLSTLTISNGNTARINAVRSEPVADILEHWQTNVYFNGRNPRLSQAFCSTPHPLSVNRHVLGEEARPFRGP